MHHCSQATDLRVDKTEIPMVGTADVVAAPEGMSAMSSQRKQRLQQESSPLTIGMALRASHVQALSIQVSPHNTDIEKSSGWELAYQPVCELEVAEVNRVSLADANSWQT
jgi:hypothetical protein